MYFFRTIPYKYYKYIIYNVYKYGEQYNYYSLKTFEIKRILYCFFQECVKLRVYSMKNVSQNSKNLYT